jgi:hypothetical protein
VPFSVRYAAFEHRLDLGYDCSMTRITVNEALLGQLSSERQEAELCDPSGRRVGYFLPEHLYRKLACQWANAQVSDEELNRCRSEGESYTTAEVLHHLQNR